MNLKDFSKSSSGKCIKTLKGYRAFVPNPLPPRLEYDGKTIMLLSEADRLLGELSGVGRVLPNPYLLIAPYIRREAVYSSRIEGTQASLSDLFFFESTGGAEPRASDVREVQNYVKAMEYGTKRLKALPISVRLIKEIHGILMEGVRGGMADPGNIRRTQNWIGPPGCTLDNAVFVPPPVDEMKRALGDWEKYIHSIPSEPPLIQCALMHYQFEAIHPFIDGNGRVGRLLITFLLCERGFLSQPMLYLSAFFNKNRDEYYSRLLAVSQKGDWQGWIGFFLQGVAIQATDALEKSKKITNLNNEYRKKVTGLKKTPESAYRLLDEIFFNPVVSISRLSKRWGLPYNSVKTGVHKLIDLGILTEVDKRKTNRLYVAHNLMSLLTTEGKE